MMISKSLSWMLVANVLTVLEEIYADLIMNNKEYLGPEPSKAFFFPWMVSVHFEDRNNKMLIGSGSIVTPKFIIGSMDCFVRLSGFGENRRYFHDVQRWVMYSGGVWGQPYGRLNPVLSQRRAVESVYMWTSVEANKAVKFESGSWPSSWDLRSYERSIFGFSMAIALLKGFDSDPWIWRRTTLPLPFSFNDIVGADFYRFKMELPNMISSLEKSPGSISCYVAGWRIGDRRLVQHSAVYVRFKHCREIYCSYSRRACRHWPVKGVHICFKSTTYVDLCWRDQGSALYCPSLKNPILAILTSAPTCGYDGLPGVFTLVHFGLEMLVRVEPKFDDLYRGLTADEKKLYAAPPKSDLILS